jgi:hypothetical protein
VIPKPLRYESEDYLDFIRNKTCKLCDIGQRTQTVSHHERLVGGGGGISRKSDDTTCIPLCTECHQKRHDKGALTFWAAYAFATNLPPMHREAEIRLMLNRLCFQYVTEYLSHHVRVDK